MTQISVRTPGTAARSTPARRSALVAVAALAVEAVVSVVAGPDAMNDHMRGAGAVSEVAVGIAFVACAATLVLLRPVAGWRGLLWWLGPVGLSVAGIVMLAVPVVGSEPPSWLVDLAVLPALVGMVTAGIVGTTARVWPWWTGLGVALFLPVMFAAPFNGLLMAGIWLAVALTAGRRTGG
jgi:hypothetical protein